jgi:hypothetical protein
MGERMEDRSVLGVGSVGISTMYYMNQNSSLPASSVLFVKSDLETKLTEKAKKSLPSQEKLDALTRLKEITQVNVFEHEGVPSEPVSPKSQTQRHYNIVGLGGQSGDFFLKLVESQNKQDQQVTTFCIMPFNFEGTARTKKAQYQLEQMQGETIVLKNQDLLKEASKTATFDESFEVYHRLIEQRVNS